MVFSPLISGCLSVSKSRRLKGAGSLEAPLPRPVCSLSPGKERGPGCSAPSEASEPCSRVSGAWARERWRPVGVTAWRCDSRSFQGPHTNLIVFRVHAVLGGPFWSSVGDPSSAPSVAPLSTSSLLCGDGDCGTDVFVGQVWGVSFPQLSPEQDSVPCSHSLLCAQEERAWLGEYPAGLCHQNLKFKQVFLEGRAGRAPWWRGRMSRALRCRTGRLRASERRQEPSTDGRVGADSCRHRRERGALGRGVCTGSGAWGTRAGALPLLTASATEVAVSVCSEPLPCGPLPQAPMPVGQAPPSPSCVSSTPCARWCGLGARIQLRKQLLKGLTWPSAWHLSSAIYLCGLRAPAWRLWRVSAAGTPDRCAVLGTRVSPCVRGGGSLWSTGSHGPRQDAARDLSAGGSAPFLPELAPTPTLDSAP